jgi:hypothetical protein
MDKLPLGFGMLCGGFFFLLTLIGGILLILYSEKSKKKVNASQFWPNINGTTTVSEVRQSSSTDDDGNTSYSYYPHVEYSYAVAGNNFIGKQIAFGGVQGFTSPSNAQAAVNKYPINTPVWIFYNPQNPAESVLERTLSDAGKVARIIGILLVILSVLIACPLIIGLFRNSN